MSEKRDLTVRGDGLESTVPPARRSPRRWQWSLSTLLLLTAAIGSWTASWNFARQNRRLEMQVAAMRTLARRLIVSDAAQYAVVELPDRWYQDDRWQVFLPAGRQHVLRLATREIGSDDQQLPAALAEAALEPGCWEFEVTQRKQDDGWLLAVLRDGQPILQAQEDNAWQTSWNWSTSGPQTTTQQSPVDRPLILLQRRFHEQRAGGITATPEGPANGLLVWIEQEVREFGERGR